MDREEQGEGLMDRKQIEANERNKQGFSPAQTYVVDTAGEAARRKATPIASGVLAYFPDALAEVARVSGAKLE
jgi:hypothetical protein